MYSQPNQDIKNLRYFVSVIHVRGYHAKFQRFLPIEKGAESFEIRPPTVLLYSRKQKLVTQQDLLVRNIYDTVEFQL